MDADVVEVGDRPLGVARIEVEHLAVGARAREQPRTAQREAVQVGGLVLLEGHAERVPRVRGGESPHVDAGTRGGRVDAVAPHLEVDHEELRIEESADQSLVVGGPRTAQVVTDEDSLSVRPGIEPPVPDPQARDPHHARRRLGRTGPADARVRADVARRVGPRDDRVAVGPEREQGRCRHLGHPGPLGPRGRGEGQQAHRHQLQTEGTQRCPHGWCLRIHRSSQARPAAVEASARGCRHGHRHHEVARSAAGANRIHMDARRAPRDSNGGIEAVARTRFTPDIRRERPGRHANRERGRVIRSGGSRRGPGAVRARPRPKQEC